MSWFGSQSKRNSTRKFQPRLEALEDRQLLSVTSTTYLRGGTWTVNCDSAHDTIVITDTGTGATNNITVNVNGQVYRPGGSVWELRLNTGAGNDRVTYNLQQALTSGGYYHELEIDLGAGHDTFTANVPGLAAGSAGLNAYVWGRDGNDNLRANVSGSLRSGTGLGIAMTGNAGHDTVVLDALTRRTNIDSGALLWSNLSGNDYGLTYNSDGNNRVELLYGGLLNGGISFNVFGSGGHDTTRSELWLDSGSTGYVGARSGVFAGGGNDLATFRIHKSTQTRVSAQDLFLDGGTGYNTGHVSRSAPITVSGFSPPATQYADGWLSPMQPTGVDFATTSQSGVGLWAGDSRLSTPSITRATATDNAIIIEWSDSNTLHDGYILEVPNVIPLADGTATLRRETVRVDRNARSVAIDYLSTGAIPPGESFNVSLFAVSSRGVGGSTSRTVQLSAPTIRVEGFGNNNQRTPTPVSNFAVWDANQNGVVDGEAAGSGLYPFGPGNLGATGAGNRFSQNPTRSNVIVSAHVNDGGRLRFVAFHLRVDPNDISLITPGELLYGDAWVGNGATTTFGTIAYSDVRVIRSPGGNVPHIIEGTVGGPLFGGGGVEYTFRLALEEA